MLAHVETADEMGRHADIGEKREDVLGNAIVEHALAADRAAFLRIERGSVVLEILDERARFGTLVKDLGLAFVDLAAARQCSLPRSRKEKRPGRGRDSARAGRVRGI